MAAGQWSFFDVSGALVRHAGAFLDYPDVEIGQNHLYLTFNVFDSSQKSQGATVMRFLLGELGAIVQGKQSGLPSYQFYNDTSVSTFRVAQNPSPGSVTYFATEKDDSDLTVYQWDEAADGQISQNDVAIPTIGKDGLGLPNGQWLGALNGGPGDQRLKAITTSDLIWPHLLVAWEGGADPFVFRQPQIDIADVNVDFTYTGGFSLNRMNYIASPTQAFGNPQLATNDYGDVAISFWHNGAGVQHAIGAIGPGSASDPTAPLRANLGPDTTAGPNTAGGADYTALRVSYILSANPDTIRSDCFSEAQWTGTPANPVPTWDTFGALDGACPTFSPPPQPPPSPPITHQAPTSLGLPCPASVAVGGNLSISGTISPAPYRALIRVLYTSPAGQVTGRDVYANPQGSYHDAIIPSAAGTWTVQAFFDGDVSYTPAQSAACAVSLSAPPPPPPGKQPSTISLSCPGSAIVRIGTITVSGAIQPERDGAPVTVTYTEPDNTLATHKVTTATNSIFKGSYLDSITPDQPGTWTVQASWSGDAAYSGHSSPICDITVNPEPPR